MANLEVEFCGVKFRNPLVVSSIEPTNSVDKLRRCIDAGAGGAVVKTLTDIPDMHKLSEHSKYAILNNKGRLIRGVIPRSFSFYARSGYSMDPYQEWIPRLKEVQAHAEGSGAQIIGSVGAKSMEGWRDISRAVEDCGIKLVELNFGCPHPAMMPGVRGGSMIGQDPEMAAEVTGWVANAVDIPVIIKMTPDQSRPIEVARAVKEAGASAVTLTNRYTGFAVDIETGKPYIGGPAGVGGPWIKPLSLRWVHEIHSKLGIPIAGSNGIFDARDAIEFIMSGATLMQIGSVLMLKGIEYLSNVVDELGALLDEYGYPDLPSIHGLASRQAATSYQAHFEAEPVLAVIDQEKCKYPKCVNCIRSCFHEALSGDNGELVTFDENCLGCELCYSVCPHNAIEMVGRAV
jgi:dihydroorotate dehydrogenase (fumarate)/dihydropyrimidine dehydrogenase (NAD+) subunit PreA